MRLLTIALLLAASQISLAGGMGRHTVQTARMHFINFLNEQDPQFLQFGIQTVDKIEFNLGHISRNGSNDIAHISARINANSPRFINKNFICSLDVELIYSRTLSKPVVIGQTLVETHDGAKVFCKPVED